VSRSDPSLSAIALIRDEHRALAAVLHALQRLARAVREGRAAPDFELLAAILYYVDVFPERLHHPKEDVHLFGALRRRTRTLDPLLDRLEREHAESARLVAGLHRALVHFQGGAPSGLAEFCASADAYAAFMFEHMRTEEERVLACASDLLTPEDWHELARAFREHEDPLFGARPTESFRRLHWRIANLVPRKLRPLFREGEER
jgi:hemerythrin-like domain-containing protein